MKQRIAIWGSVGALVVVLWSLYFAAKPGPVGPLGFLLDLTCPISLARSYPISVYFVLLMNAATYALIGVVVETVRMHRQIHSISN
jgi:hypothetical protein